MEIICNHGVVPWSMELFTAAQMRAKRWPRPSESGLPPSQSDRLEFSPASPTEAGPSAPKLDCSSLAQGIQCW